MPQLEVFKDSSMNDCFFTRQLDGPKELEQVKDLLSGKLDYRDIFHVREGYDYYQLICPTQKMAYQRINNLGLLILFSVPAVLLDIATLVIRGLTTLCLKERAHPFKTYLKDLKVSDRHWDVDELFVRIKPGKGEKVEVALTKYSMPMI